MCVCVFFALSVDLQKKTAQEVEVIDYANRIASEAHVKVMQAGVGQEFGGGLGGGGRGYFTCMSVVPNCVGCEANHDELALRSLPSALCPLPSILYALLSAF